MKRILFAVALLFSPAAAQACLWDYDTLAAERSRFPTVLEIITGKFLRHSPEYYEWRVQDRLKKIETDPDNVALYDDLAVAYDKLGQQDKAIETILGKDKLKPGLYETEANLGTFLIHAGRYEEGLVHINRAIEINPDAHFGREKYQVLLVEYLVPRQKDGKPRLPLAQVGEASSALQPMTFAEFLRDKHGGQLSRDVTQEAIQGVLGIMRFSKHDSPVLLEALASLLGNSMQNDAKQLAARAYLAASYSVQDETVASQYYLLAEDELEMQVGTRLGGVEKQLKDELADANAWYDRLHERERHWIASGDDVDLEFGKLYHAEPVLQSRGISSYLFGDIRLTVVIASLSLALVIASVRAVYKVACTPLNS